MSRHRFELMEYHNEQLMDDLNEFMISVKVHLFNIPINRPKPTLTEIDQLFSRLIHELKKDSMPLVKY